jgi:hypothetical protein
MDISRISDLIDIKEMRNIITKNEALELIKLNDEKIKKEK